MYWKCTVKYTEILNWCHVSDLYDGINSTTAAIYVIVE